MSKLSDMVSGFKDSYKTDEVFRSHVNSLVGASIIGSVVSIVISKRYYKLGQNAANNNWVWFLNKMVDETDIISSEHKNCKFYGNVKKHSHTVGVDYSRKAPEVEA